MANLNVKEAIGATKNNVLFDCSGTKSCLGNNFSASAIGWKIPLTLTLFGPTRFIEYAKTFRSIKV